jgi:O-antigen ligase
MAGILVVPGVYVLLTLWLALYGLWYVRGFAARVWQPSLTLGAAPIWVGMAVYVGVGMGLGWWHGYRASYFEAYLPMLLAPLIVNAVVVAKPPVAMLWLGAAAGAALAGLMAMYQSLVLDVGRAGGAMNNVIMFGDLSVVLAMFTMFGWIYWGRAQKSRWIQAAFLLGTLLGLAASLLSGTKGGWLSILMLAVVFVWLAFDRWHWFKKVIVAGLVLATIVIAAFLAPPDVVVNRITNGFQGAQTWFKSGEITDGSVSIRLEKWAQALGMIADKPWTGWSTEGSIIEIDQRLRAAGAGEGPGGFWTQTENDLLQAGIVHGLPGVASYLCLYLGIVWGFVRARQRWPDHRLWVGLASAGAVLIVLMLEFGLSVVVLGRNAFRHTMIVWAMLALAYLIVLWQHRQAQQEPS